MSLGTKSKLECRHTPHASSNREEAETEIYCYVLTLCSLVIHAVIYMAQCMFWSLPNQNFAPSTWREVEMGACMGGLRSTLLDVNTPL